MGTRRRAALPALGHLLLHAQPCRVGSPEGANGRRLEPQQGRREALAPLCFEEEVEGGSAVVRSSRITAVVSA